MIFSVSVLLFFCYILTYLLEKAMATHFSTLAWEIPWTEEPGGLQCMGPQSRTRFSDKITSENYDGGPNREKEAKYLAVIQRDLISWLGT